VRKPKQSRGRDRRLADAEESTLIQTARNSRSFLLAPIITLAIETAMRLGELLALEWGNIDLKNQTALLPLTKNGEARIVPLTKRAIDILQSIPHQLNNPRVFWVWVRPDSFENAWCRMLGQTSIQDLRFHDLRHEACSRLFERGFNIMEVAHISGHKTLQQLKRYRRPLPQARHQRCNVLQLESQIRRADDLGGAAFKSAGKREQQAQAFVGQVASR
jgi:integrase